MQYLATVGRPKKAESYDMHAGTDSMTSALASVEKRVLDSNPILEAFGNAKTLRNENSSRFGKFICMQFNSFGELIGAKIDTYLLEKVRLVNQSRGERNYHIFYQMCAGGSEEEKSRWELTDPRQYHFVNQSNCYKLREIDDNEEYHTMRKAMDTIGIQSEEQDGIFDALAALMHLSNLAFADPSGCVSTLGAAAPSSPRGGKPASVSAKASASGSAVAGQCTIAGPATAYLETASRLLGVEADKFAVALSSKEIVARTERYKTFFSLQQCCAAAEATAKSVYGKLFLYLVFAINKRIRAPPSKVASFIGVLDIFGKRTTAAVLLNQLPTLAAGSTVVTDHHVYNRLHSSGCCSCSCRV